MPPKRSVPHADAAVEEIKGTDARSLQIIFHLIIFLSFANQAGLFQRYEIRNDGFNGDPDISASHVWTACRGQLVEINLGRYVLEIFPYCYGLALTPLCIIMLVNYINCLYRQKAKSD